MIIDGRKIAADILGQLKKDVKELVFQPVFCDVLVGQDPASAQYVRMKAKKAESVGIKFRGANFPADIPAQDLTAQVKAIGQEPNMCGLIVQLPLPEGLPRQEILDAIDPTIDVDCMGQKNMKDFYAGNIHFVPPTAAAVMEMLGRLKLNLAGKRILILGRGELVGKPAAFLLQRLNLQVEVANRSTPNTSELLRQADVIISATGKGGLVTGDKIKPGCIVIDAGTSESNGSIVGDADFESVSKVAGFLSPVPGGVGPVTVAMLLGNVVKAAGNKRI